MLFQISLQMLHVTPISLKGLKVLSYNNLQIIKSILIQRPFSKINNTEEHSQAQELKSFTLLNVTRVSGTFLTLADLHFLLQFPSRVWEIKQAKDNSQQAAHLFYQVREWHGIFGFSWHHCHRMSPGNFNSMNYQVILVHSEWN